MGSSPTPLSEIRFGSFLIYSPRGASNISQASKEVCHRVKVDGTLQPSRRNAIDYAVKRFREVAPPDSQIGDLLGSDVVLVPSPRSAPFPDKRFGRSLWPALRICEALHRVGYGASVATFLERLSAIPKSAVSAPGHRPSTADHIESMKIVPTLSAPSRITVVDDVVTKGATLLASASLISAAFPDAEVRGFALIRTMGRIPEVDQIVDPAFGTIRLMPDGDVDRSP